MVDLASLINKFQSANNRENDVASFQAHVPWVAPDAYLNVIFKPAPPDVLSDVGTRMKIPTPVLELLARNNGVTCSPKSTHN